LPIRRREVPPWRAPSNSCTRPRQMR
jgi:hypothetical protein